MQTMQTSPTVRTITAPQRTAGPTTTIVEVARRTVRKFARSPQLAVVGTIQGAMFLLIFRYVFGGAINTGAVPYVDFLVPGFVLTGVLFSGSSAASGVAEDLEAGFIDRLRSLPIPRSSVMAGRALADTVTATWGLLITTAIGFAVGFRLHNGVGRALAAFGLCIVAAYAFSWVFIFIGLVSGTAQAAQGISLLVFPLTFVSSGYVPVGSMPGWMQSFAQNQPITVMVDAVRSLVLGANTGSALPHSTGYYVIGTFVWAAGISLVFGALSIARYRRG
jgi:ABC-2 type transport system permease protein